MSIQDDAQAAVEAAQKVCDDLAATPPVPPVNGPGIEFVEIHYVDGTVSHLVPEGSGEPEVPTDTPTPPPVSDETSVMAPGTAPENTGE